MGTGQWQRFRTYSFITLASEGLKNAPVKMVREFHFVHKIVGWGEVRIPTAYGPSNYFPCLLDKVAGYQNFKLYVNGRPASKAVSNIILEVQIKYFTSVRLN